MNIQNDILVKEIPINQLQSSTFVNLPLCKFLSSFLSLPTEKHNQVVALSLNSTFC